MGEFHQRDAGQLSRARHQLSGRRADGAVENQDGLGYPGDSLVVADAAFRASIAAIEGREFVPLGVSLRLDYELF